MADRLLAGEPFRRSENDYDWLGSGVYFWEYGIDRAWQFAGEQQRRGTVARPAVVGAIVQLGHCFDLLETWARRDLADAFYDYSSIVTATGTMLPRNTGKTPDKELRRLDCSVLNHWLGRLDSIGPAFDTVRCGFVEGAPVFPDSGIARKSHIQIAVRNPACILGVFRPIVRP